MASFKKDKRPPVDVNNVFIKFLPQDVSDDGLRRMFENFGVISSCKVMIDQTTGKSLGYGHVSRFADAFVRFCLSQRFSAEQ